MTWSRGLAACLRGVGEGMKPLWRCLSLSWLRNTELKVLRGPLHRSCRGWDLILRVEFEVDEPSIRGNWFTQPWNALVDADRLRRGWFGETDLMIYFNGTWCFGSGREKPGEC